MAAMAGSANMAKPSSTEHRIRGKRMADFLVSSKTTRTGGGGGPGSLKLAGRSLLALLSLVKGGRNMDVVLLLDWREAQGGKAGARRSTVARRIPRITAGGSARSDARGHFAHRAPGERTAGGTAGDDDGVDAGVAGFGRRLRQLVAQLLGLAA